MSTVKISILDEYPDVLEPNDIKEILRIGRKQTYELFKQKFATLSFC
jgi:hypothetical protein